ncbi:MAG: hypothetical protein ACRBCI_16030 [Cellvibrionaceae bacterium]
MLDGSKTKYAALFALISGGYLAYLFVTTLGVSTVYIEPTGCQQVVSLSPQQYDTIQYFAELKLKRKAKRAGADTLYVPPNIGNLINKKAMVSGTGYKCTKA